MSQVIHTPIRAQTLRRALKLEIPKQQHNHNPQFQISHSLPETAPRSESKSEHWTQCRVKDFFAVLCPQPSFWLEETQIRLCRITTSKTFFCRLAGLAADIFWDFTNGWLCEGWSVHHHEYGCAFGDVMAENNGVN